MSSPSPCDHARLPQLPKLSEKLQQHLHFSANTRHLSYPLRHLPLLEHDECPDFTLLVNQMVQRKPLTDPLRRPSACVRED